MKSIYLSTTFLVLFVAIMVVVPLSNIQAQETAIENPIQSEKLDDILQRLTRVLVGAGIPIFILMMSIGSYYLITGADNPGNRVKARKIFFYSFLGFFIIMISAGIAALVKSIFS